MFALRLASKYLDRKSLIKMANSLVFSHLNYYNTAPGQACTTSLNRLQRRQDKAVRIIKRLPQKVDEDTLSKARRELGWLDLQGKRHVHKATTIFKCLSGSATDVLCSLFIKRVVSRATRLKDVLMVPTRCSLKLLAYRGARFWNSLPSYIQDSLSSEACKTSVHRFLLDNPGHLRELYK